jgi:RNA polymerase sigma-70 factor (ECF subfamily)
MADVTDTLETDESRDLLARAGVGDGEALGLLFARHREALRRAVARRLGTGLGSRIDPSDVVQEAQIEAFRRLPEYLGRRPMPFRHWLFRTAAERLLKLRRQASAARRDVSRERPLADSGSLSSGHDARLAVARPTPSQEVAARDLDARLHSVLGRLPEADQAILTLRALEGLPYEEVAARLAIEPAAARKRYGRALLRLRALLVADGVSESR